jgi:hypothetical protein
VLKIVSIITVSVAVTFAAGATYAGGGASAFAPGQNKDALLSQYGEGGPEETGSPTPGGVVHNLGGAISGGFYGNTSNAGVDGDAPDRGHGVTPSISPGPQTVGGDGPGTGTSIGEAIQSQR